MRKVELSVMKPWIAKKTMELLGFEDEVVIEYVCGLLEDAANPVSAGALASNQTTQANPHFVVGIAFLPIRLYRLSMEKR
jgi:hypothetical protein